MRHNPPVHVDMTVGLQLVGELRGEQLVVLLGEVAESVLHGLHELLLVENDGSLRGVGQVGVQGLPTRHGTIQNGTIREEGPGGYL